MIGGFGNRKVIGRVILSPDTFYVTRYIDKPSYTWVDLAGALGGYAMGYGQIRYCVYHSVSDSLELFLSLEWLHLLLLSGSFCLVVAGTRAGE